MHGSLVTSDGALDDDAAGTSHTIDDPDADTITATLRSGGRFWLDLAATDEPVLTLLRGAFGFHPLAVEDVEHFAQRPKIDVYEDVVVMVAYGLASGDTPVEVHCFLGDSYLVTVHRGPSASISAALARLRRGGELPAPIMLLHRVLDALVDDFFPQLEAFDESIDTLQDDILRKPSDAQLGTLFELKRRLIRMRRLTTDQRDVIAEILTGRREIPGFDTEAERYFGDLHDHLARLAQTADGYRDLLSSALDTHLSTTSNRLNVVMKQLAIIATIFLPMTFLTGFFGQNFGWMTDRIGGSWVFWCAGVALPVAVAAALMAMFHRMGWWGSNAD